MCRKKMRASCKKDMEVEVRIPALPKQTITGRLSFVSPIVDPATRTVEVRMDVANANGFSSRMNWPA